jgi:hypothetical protein
MRSLFDPPIFRLRVPPPEPDGGETPIVGKRPPGSRRPHTDAKTLEVRRLIEQTTLTYGEISKKTGVGRASICRWTRDGGWQRPLFAPRATDTVPSIRASQKLKLRKLAERLRLLAERAIRELEADPQVDIDKLMQALQGLKMARLEAMGRRRRRRAPDGTAYPGSWWISRDEAIRSAIKDIHRGGVDVDKVPDEAMQLFEDAYSPPDDHPALHPPKARRGGRRRRR